MDETGINKRTNVWPHNVSSLGVALLLLCCFVTCQSQGESYIMQCCCELHTIQNCLPFMSQSNGGNSRTKLVECDSMAKTLVSLTSPKLNSAIPARGSSIEKPIRCAKLAKLFTSNFNKTSST